MRGFILLSLQRYGSHSRRELESDCRSVGSREPFEEQETFDQAVAGLIAGGMIRSERVDGEEMLLPVYSREKKREMALVQEWLFE